MRLIRLKLRGAIGLRPYGDEIEIKFYKFAQGPVAVIGSNGAGKSTILENLQPWPTLISRDGALAKHYYLKDSIKELEFEHNGQVYISKALIDGEHNKIEAYLYCDGKPLNKDGKTTSYKIEIKKLFGSPDIYFKSIFQSQGGAHISELRAGGKKEFFISLLGLDRYQRLVEACKINSDTIQLDKSNLDGKLDQVNEQIAGNKPKIESRSIIDSQKTQAETDIIELQNEINAHQSTLKILEQKQADRNSMSGRIGNLEKDKYELETEIENLLVLKNDGINRIDDEIAEHEKLITRLQKCIENADTIRDSVNKTEKLSTELGGLEILKSQISELEIKKNDLKYKIKSHKDDLANQEAKLGNDIDNAQKLAGKLNTVPCVNTEFVDVCPLIRTAKKADDSISGLESRKARIQVESGKLIPEEDELSNIEKQIAEIDYDQEHHNSLVIELGKLRKTNWSQLLSELDKSETTIDERQRQIELLKNQKLIDIGANYDNQILNAKRKVVSKAAEIKILKGKMNDDLQPEINKISNRIKVQELELAELNILLGKYNGELETIEKLNAENEKLIEQSNELQIRQKLIISDISDWILLERAFGKNDLQALELDSACPQISSIATEILQQFGREWSVKFITDRPSADKKKDIETFEIIISTPDGIRNFDDLSGGERVWIEESLRKAITIYLINHSGKEFKTLFQDEADGALDPERAQAFLQTAFKAHELTGAHHTFIISQRPEIWQQIPQRIVLDPEKGTIETVVE